MPKRTAATPGKFIKIPVKSGFLIVLLLLLTVGGGALLLAQRLQDQAARLTIIEETVFHLSGNSVPVLMPKTGSDAGSSNCHVYLGGAERLLNCSACDAEGHYCAVLPIGSQNYQLLLNNCRPQDNNVRIWNCDSYQVTGIKR